jgi:hypothetical protein
VSSSSVDGGAIFGGTDVDVDTPVCTCFCLFLGFSKLISDIFAGITYTTQYNDYNMMMTITKQTSLNGGNQ